MTSMMEWLPESDLNLADRNIHIFTTAALPWRTGTSINALLRALYILKEKLKKGDQGHVHLVIPWLDGTTSSSHRLKLYGPGVITLDGDAGKQQQSEWIRTYASQVCGMHEEAQSLCITYYDAMYWDPLGSIFPIVDLTTLIPHNMADVAILEEPEHLNWFQISTHADNRLAWKQTFRFVVGVIHTNYSAYMKQYGFGTSLFTSPVLDAMSSLVVRAYCHKIIRLSESVPSFAPHKEICCNVHGVRSTFFSQSSVEDNKDDDQKDDDASRNQNHTDHHHTTDADADADAPIYFVGKLLWAKGFDKMLHIQEEYRKVYGHYFTMDIYGGGPDEKAIQRAFFGRIQPVISNTSSSDHGNVCKEEDETTPPSSTSSSKLYNDVFHNSWSLRSQLVKLTNATTHTTTTTTQNPYYNEALQYMTNSLEDEDESSHKSDTSNKNSNFISTHQSSSSSSMVHDLYKRIVGTGVETSQAMFQLTNFTFSLFLQATFTTVSQDGGMNHKMNDTDLPSPYTKDMVFDPPQSFHEFRKNPIPARFLGVKDHAAVGVSSKIFLNPSVTEVLCTTTAEALAMGKFVIIPFHPSNYFFLQFPNCLAYQTMRECVEKIQYALENKPMELSDTYKDLLTWEAATIRLYNSCRISKQVYESEEMRKKDEEDEKMQWLHSQGMRKGRFLHDLFHKLSF